MTPSLLELLPELRERVHLLDYWFIIKRYNSGTAKWKTGIEQGMWEGAQSLLTFCLWGATLPAPPHIQQPGSSLNPILWRFYGDFIMWFD